mgnify:FL=1
MKKNTKTNEKKKKGGKAKIILLIILLIILICGGLFAYKVHKNGGGLQGMAATLLGHDEETVNKLPKMYCLILGKSENLTDTIMLASYDPKTQEAALLSIPRDTFVGTSESNASPSDKINAIYNMYTNKQKGLEKLLEKVRKLTDIDVRYYVMVDTKALRALVDEIGGVTFDVPIDMKYDDNRQNLHINLKAGVQKLNGDKAEQVVRFRHNNNGTTYPSSYGVQDIGRMKTQRAFLTALAKQTLVPANITKIPEFLDIAKQYVETNIDLNTIKDYVPYAVNFNTDNLKTDKLPGAAQYINGWSFYKADKTKTAELIKKLFYTQVKTDDTDGNSISENTVSEGSTSTKLDRAKINVEVLNGSGSNTNLSEFVAELKSAGYRVNKTGKTTTTSKTAIINRGEVSDDIISDIKKILATGSSTSGSSNGSTDVTIILGTDYIL